MAPQNSALIHENSAELESDLSRYSPILTIKDEVGSNNMHIVDDNCDYDDDRAKSISSSEDINILQVS